MIQVIITTSAREREECIERLEEMGYRKIGDNMDYNDYPDISVNRDQRNYYTISEYGKQITASEFLTQKIETI